MTEFRIALDPTVSAFYERIAVQAGLPPERVLADALFRMAGELSREALRRSGSKTREQV